MQRTRLSLFYLAGYLITGGVLLLFAPKFALKLLLSHGDYGDVFPRLAGMLLTGLGILVVQIIRQRLETLYATTLVVRAFFCACLLIFYGMSHDSLFLVLLAIVGLGLLLSGFSYLSERHPAESREGSGKASTDQSM